MGRERLAPTIGGVARAAGVNVETIRFYQRKGLLPSPDRPARGIHRYGRAEIERLRFIKSAQRLGFSLEEISELLRLDDGTHCAQARQLAERKLADVRHKLTHLGRLEAALSDLVHACRNPRGNVSCPLIASLHEAERPSPHDEHELRGSKRPV
jgi:MerR family mercuric resistance operon transcriptional regulator